jgi:hypothetical protein
VNFVTLVFNFEFLCALRVLGGESHTNKKAVLTTDSPLGWQTISYNPGAAVRARQGIAMGIIMDAGKVVLFIGLSLLCTAPGCKW